MKCLNLSQIRFLVGFGQRIPFSLFVATPWDSDTLHPNAERVTYFADILSLIIILSLSS